MDPDRGPETLDGDDDESGSPHFVDNGEPVEEDDDGGDYSALAQTEALNRRMEAEQFGIAEPALQAGTSYLLGQYGQGGMNMDAKYQAQQTMAGEASLGGNILSGNLGTAAGQRASSFAGVAGAKIGAGVDELNKLRSLLGQKGLQTTNLGQEAGGLSVSALSQSGVGNNPTLSAILGVGAAGASIYGGLKNQGQQDQIAAILSRQGYGGNPSRGSDVSYLAGSGTATATPGAPSFP